MPHEPILSIPGLPRPGERTRPLPPPLRWDEVFERPSPVEIEVGPNKGRFLVAAARQNPGINYLGVEIRRAHADLLAERLRKHGLTNARVLHADAAMVIHALVPAASVEAIHLYYPDPWWKARHLKRRLVTDEFLADCARALRTGGMLRVATDVADYFEVIAGLLDAGPVFRREAAPAGSLGSAEAPMTSFQEKGLRAGRGIHGGVWARSEAPAPSTPDPRERLALRRRSTAPFEPD